MTVILGAKFRSGRFGCDGVSCTVHGDCRAIISTSFKDMTCLRPLRWPLYLLDNEIIIIAILFVSCCLVNRPDQFIADLCTLEEIF